MADPDRHCASRRERHHLHLTAGRGAGAPRQSSRGSHAYIEVRYEDLVSSPQPVLENICKFIHLDFDPCMLRYWERAPGRLTEHCERRHRNGALIVSREKRLEQQRLTAHPPDPARIGVWRTEMTPVEQMEFSRGAGELLERLGYAW